MNPRQRNRPPKEPPLPVAVWEVKGKNNTARFYVRECKVVRADALLDKYLLGLELRAAWDVCHNNGCRVTFIAEEGVDA